MGQYMKKFFKENKSLLIFISLMLVFRSAVADWNDVPTGSMKPTIVEGDRIFVNKMAYDLRIPFSQTSLIKFADPKPNDIIIFESAEADKRLVKRVIGVPGDTVALNNNKLVINNEPVSYKMLTQSKNFIESEETINNHKHIIRTKTMPGEQAASRLANFREVIIPNDFYLVMGDNRDSSADSRVIGLVPRNEIIGRSTTVALSLNYDNYLLPRTERFFKTL